MKDLYLDKDQNQNLNKIKINADQIKMQINIMGDRHQNLYQID